MMRTLTNLIIAVSFLISIGSEARADQSEVESQLVALFEAQDTYLEARRAATEDLSLDDEVLEELAVHPDWRVRTQASILLGWRLQRDVFSAVYEAAPVVGRQGRKVRFLSDVFSDPSAVPAILERLLHGGESDVVRTGLAHALVGLYPHWGEDMIGLLGAEQGASLALAAVAAFQWADSEVALAGLRLALDHRHAEVRAAAASVAGWRADGLGIAQELRATLSDESAGTRSKAARALGWLGDTEASRGLVSLLSDEDAEVRLHALRSLDRIDASQAEREVQTSRFGTEQDERVLRVLRRIRSR
jgi:HEAT repeat protein